MPDIVVFFFALGVVAGLARSDLKVPEAAYDTLSILLMLTIGLKGGLAMHGRLEWSMVPQLGGIVLLGVFIPLACYPVLRSLVKLSVANSASLAAHYGSVSAGTFAVALAYAQSLGLPILPQTTLYLVLLELPAIIVAILLFNRLSNVDVKASRIWHEALTSRGVVLLVGGVLAGYLYGPERSAAVSAMFLNAFSALLALFLLEMGRVTAKTLLPLPWHHWRVMVFALVAPFALGCLGLLIAVWLELPAGTALILASLTASASYIAAPAAVRGAVPEADIGLALLAALGITFPLNVIIGIPLYHQLLTILS